MKKVTKESTIDAIKRRTKDLETFAVGLVELFDADRDGDDYWTAFDFGDGSFADINIWIDVRGSHEYLLVDAYPVLIDGSTDTRAYRTLYKGSLKAKYNRHEGDNF